MQLKLVAIATTALTGLLAASPAQAQQADDQAARIQALEAQIQQLQQAVSELKARHAEIGSAPAPAPIPAPAPVAATTAAPAPAPAIGWKGAPQIADADSGWSFKPRGRLMYDFATADGPDGYDYPGFGFSNEVRRARLGVEGKMPGDFGYKLEVDVAGGDVEFADAFFTYAPGAVDLTFGHHNNFQSLEELTSSLHTSFIERAAFTDAFGFERRVGASVQYLKGDILAQGGIFTDSIADLNTIGDRNDSYGFDGRLVFMPRLGANQLHFAGSAHWRDLNDSASIARYRQRPAVHSTDVRLIDTGPILHAETERGLGLEAAGIFGPFHLASEAYWQQVGRASGHEEPTFFGAYIEGGYFLTGERRGYKEGKFDRVRVRKPVGSGGWGALGVNLRWDYLDLIDVGFSGGEQNALQASLNWKPTDYVLFGLNYGHIRYDDAAIAPGGDGDYSVDMIGLRSQIDF